MLLGKRPRPSMSRTTSMTEFANAADADVGATQPTEQIQQQRSYMRDRQRPTEMVQQQRRAPSPAVSVAAAAAEGGGGNWLEGRYMVSPRSGSAGHRRYLGEVAPMETAPFLRNCGLCKRRLMPGRDIFMYRGDIAFCSLECREQQISLDEKKDKSSIRTTKDTAA